jgi:hypothetical protein
VTVDRIELTIDRSGELVDRNAVTVDRIEPTIDRSGESVDRNAVTVDRNAVTVDRNALTVDPEQVPTGASWRSIGRSCEAIGEVLSMTDRNEPPIANAGSVTPPSQIFQASRGEAVHAAGMSTALVRVLRAPKTSLLKRWFGHAVAAIIREATHRRALLEQVRLRPGHRILDLGCGAGTFPLFVKRSVPRATVVALDTDEELLELARAKARAQHIDVTFTAVSPRKRSSMRQALIA